MSTGGRETDFEGTSAGLAAVGRRESHTGGNRQAFGAERAAASRAYRQTGYDARLVSKTGRCEIRRLETAPVARPTAHKPRDRGSGDSLGTRKLRLGLRSDCRSVGQLGAPSVRSDRGQHSAPPWDRAGAGEEQNDHLEGVHSPAYEFAS